MEQMDSGIMRIFNLLDFDGENVLFQQREDGQARTPFEMEREVLARVAAGDADEMVTHYRSLLSKPGMKISVGKLSKNELQHFKYMAVSAITLVCRVAMYNGAPEAVSYSMSDEAILAIDRMKHPERILLYLLKLIYKYTELVGESKKNIGYSLPVRQGIEYITANLHSRIVLEDLVQGTDYTKDYYAKLFKREVGQSFTDYVLNLRIQEAKKMIQAGKSGPEIPYVLQFCSQSYFIRQFKKVTGMTPREYKLLQHTPLLSMRKR